MSEHEGLDLSQIPGLGPVRRQALEEAGIRDLKGLLALKVAELAAIRGVGLWQARKISEFLRQRGLLMVTDGDQGPGIVVSRPRTREEAAALADAARAMEAQAEQEAVAEAQVEALSEAVAEAERDTRRRRRRGVSREEAEVLQQSNGARGDEAAAAAPMGEAAEEQTAPVDWREEVKSRRERVPETAVALMEAIRQAAVTRKLTRQITLFLITAGDFIADGKHVGDRQRRRAAEALEEVEGLLHRAMEKQRFDAKAQEDLSDRIRKRRKELEKLLERDEANA
jgi:hypothetical protein